MEDITGLNFAQQRFLLDTVEVIQSALNAGNTGLACRDLAGLTEQVQHFVANGQLSAAQVSDILADITAAQAVLGCA